MKPVLSRTKCLNRHLRDLMADEKRCMSLIKESEGIYFDFCRQRVTPRTIEVCVPHLSRRLRCSGCLPYPKAFGRDR
jgi:hypothetical protein